MKISISRTVLYAAGALLVVLISAALVRYHDHRQIGVTLAVTAGYSAALAVVLLTVRRERDRRAKVGLLLLSLGVMIYLGEVAAYVSENLDETAWLDQQRRGLPFDTRP